MPYDQQPDQSQMHVASPFREHRQRRRRQSSVVDDDGHGLRGPAAAAFEDDDQIATAVWPRSSSWRGRRSRTSSRPTVLLLELSATRGMHGNPLAQRPSHRGDACSATPAWRTQHEHRGPARRRAAVARYLQAHTAVTALCREIVSRTPPATDGSWIRYQLIGRPDERQRRHALLRLPPSVRLLRRESRQHLRGS